ncbi:MAG: fibronectin type III domain-containing protein [Candidatus Nanopelagicales bacterium]
MTVLAAPSTRTRRAAAVASSLCLGLALVVAAPAASADPAPDGAVLSWGANQRTMSGNGFDEYSGTPTSPDPLPGAVTGVAATTQGSLVHVGTRWYAWGENDSGALCTDRVEDDHYSPVRSVLPDAQKVVGSYHTLALLPNGSVVACGTGSAGQLGDGFWAEEGWPYVRPSPVQVTGLTSGVVDVAAGGSFSLAARADGTVRAWGSNASGQLGIGVGTDLQTTPTVVGGATGVVAVAAGISHSLALTSSGTVLAWGDNSRGQLGDGTTTGRAVPGPVAGLSQIVAIAASGSTSFALRDDGVVLAWGYNGSGLLGDAGTSDSALPQAVPGLSDVVEVKAGLAHAIARLQDGTVVGWGANNVKQLGNGRPTVGTLAPAVVAGLSDVVALGVGDYHSTAVLQDGSVRTWGGSLRTGSTTQAWMPIYTTPTPAVAPADQGIVQISSGGGAVIALTDTGTVLTWGGGAGGALGTGSLTDSSVPLEVPGLTSVRQVAVTLSGTAFALKDDGSIWAWGDNRWGAVGDGTTTQRNTPVPVLGLPGPVTSISAGDGQAFALLADGTVWSWGRNNYSQLGYASAEVSTTPARVPGLSDIASVSAGTASGLAVTRDGTLLAWGDGQQPLLGSGAGSDPSVPRPVPGITDVVAAEAGSGFDLALRSDRTVWSWGYYAFGALGDGGTSNRFVPAQIATLTNIRAISGRHQHAMALGADGTVYAWGLGMAGELGNGTTWDANRPTPVTGLPRVKAISAGAFFSAAVTGTPTSAPGSPTAVSATAGAGSATVSWTPPADDGGAAITGYTVTASPGGVTATAAAGATSTTVPGLTNGTSYTFTVRATNASGDSPASQPSAAVTPVAPPSPPTNVAGASRVGAVRVTWAPPTDLGGLPVTQYLVRTVETGAVRTVAGTATAVLISGLSAGTPYSFTVVARNAAGDSPASAPSAAVVPASGPPDAPTDVAAVAGSTKASVSWTPPVGTGGVAISSYTVTASPGGRKATVAAPLTTATVTGLSNGTSYTFTVVAKNVANQTSVASSPSAPVTPATLPKAPPAPLPTAYKAAAVVSWTAPADGGSPITGYVVEVFQGTTSVRVVPVGSAPTTLTVTGLTNGTAYRFTVRAVNAVGTGPASAKSAAVKPLAGLPAPP